LRLSFIYIVFIFSLSLNAQTSVNSDTIVINEVVIRGKISNPVPAGFKKTTVDTSLLKNYSLGTLAELLSGSSNIIIKSYGMGSSATPSFRGTGAGHTQLAWNSININHPMLGQADLSLIPAGLIDNVSIYHGGASMVLSNGGIGGLINIESKPEWKDETLIALNPGFGSFGQYSCLFQVKNGNKRFQTVTKAFLQSAENDFRYLNTEIGADPVWETRNNSQINQEGIIQELYYRKEKNIASARIWYQAANRNLPGTMLTASNNSGEKQSDESLRILLNYDYVKRNINYFATGAYLLSKLNYSNSLAGLDSKNRSESLILKYGMESRPGRIATLKVFLQEELNVVKTNNYEGNASRNTASLTASAESNSSNRLIAHLLLRETLDKIRLLLPDFSAGLQYSLSDKSEQYLKANISRNSRLPTMNDLFWVPGGNPELRNEYAFTYELTYETKLTFSDINFISDISLFRNNIKDMIQWYPGEYSFWTAGNIKSVVTAGVEASASLIYAVNNFSSRLNAAYSFTKAGSAGSDGKIEEQLIYIPKNHANISYRFGYKGIYSIWSANFTGRRYTTVDNSRYLPAYFLNNLSAGSTISLKSFLLDLNLKIDNLFGINYQTIAYHPMPGRYYSINLLIKKLITR
jgi:iron complex outermembrane receptor protein